MRSRRANDMVPGCDNDTYGRYTVRRHVRAGDPAAKHVYRMYCARTVCVCTVHFRVGRDEKPENSRLALCNWGPHCQTAACSVGLGRPLFACTTVVQHAIYVYNTF